MMGKGVSRVDKLPADGFSDGTQAPALVKIYTERLLRPREVVESGVAQIPS